MRDPEERVLSTRVAAPAKINLHLRVGPPTADGFHPLLSWMVTVGLFDILDLELSPASERDAPTVRLSCDDPSIPTDRSNLVVKAAAAMLELYALQAAHRQAEPWSLSAALRKRIPVGAGLGGGSSDGAATMMALDRLLALNSSPQRLATLAAQFGSDLPFFFFAPSSVCTGRGEIVEPIAPPTPRHAVLLLPDIHMPTAAVYRQFDQMNLGRNEALQDAPDWHRWSTLSATQLLPLLVNDLEAPAFAINPGLALLHQRSGNALGRIVRMSGSGSSLFSLFDSRPQAESAAVCLREALGDALGIRVIAVDLCPNARAADIDAE
jgi:4-diphosphocytidyl-2-C-methyl-D-erythritol kinase